MASAALPEWATDLPGDIADFFNDLALIQEDRGGGSFWATGCCCATTEQVVGGKCMWQDQRIVSRNRLPSHTPLRCYDDEVAALGRKLSDMVPSGPWVLPLTPAKWTFQLFPCPSATPKPTRQLRGYDTSTQGWTEIDVPLSWEVAGFSHAMCAPPAPASPCRGADGSDAFDGAVWHVTVRTCDSR